MTGHLGSGQAFGTGQLSGRGLLILSLLILQSAPYLRRTSTYLSYVGMQLSHCGLALCSTSFDLLG